MYSAGGDELGGCGNGRKDCLTLLYLPIASSPSRPPITDSLTGEVSLIPRLWPAVNWKLLEPVEDKVLVLLRGKGFDNCEYAEEFVEVLEVCRTAVGDWRDVY